MKNLLLFTAALLLFAQLSAQCGKERWAVKTLTDKDTSLIDFEHPLKSTVSEQCGLPKPAKVGKTMPRQALEMKVYVIDCFILDYKKEEDHDIHLVLKDLHTGQTMVAELAGPDCPELRNSPWYPQMKAAYDFFVSHIRKPTTKFKTLNPPVKARVTGVGFFDFIHGQRGMAPNGREIHPVLRIELIH
jgi:hypothetical protein